MNNQPTILVIDDTKTNLDILLEFLGDKYDVIPVLSAKLALEVLKTIDIDLILLDIIMPEMNGFELCKKLKANPNTKDIPVIFITSKDDEDSIEKAYDLGGVDYITRPFKLNEILFRVKMQLKVKKNIEHLEYISFHDPLTGIYNRRKFFDLANHKFKNNKENLFAVMIDIDEFKTINDTYGHSKGDRVLKNVVKILDKLKPKNSILGRLGGEEFALVFNEEDEFQLIQNIEEIRKEIELKNIDNISVTISIGISKYTKNFKSLDELLQDADNALYDAKGKGRNKSVFRGVEINKDEKFSVFFVDDKEVMQEILSDVLEEDTFEKYKDAKILMLSTNNDEKIKEDISFYGLSNYSRKLLEKEVIIEEMNLRTNSSI